MMDINKAVKHLQDDIHEQIARYKADAEEINVNNAELHRKYAKVYGGELLADKLASLDQEASERKKELYDGLYSACNKLIIGFNRKIDNYIKCSCVDDLQAIQNLSWLITDEKEYSFIIERYGNRNYWNDKLLRFIGNEKHFDVDMLNPSLERIQEVTEKLLQEVAECKGDHE